MADTNYEREMAKAMDYVREQNAERRREEARAKKEEKRAAQKAARAKSNERSKSLPWICKLDNWLHDVTKQPRNY